jgi:hypothetical protein
MCVDQVPPPQRDPLRVAVGAQNPIEPCFQAKTNASLYLCEYLPLKRQILYETLDLEPCSSATSKKLM